MYLGDLPIKCNYTLYIIYMKISLSWITWCFLNFLVPRDRRFPIKSFSIWMDGILHSTLSPRCLCTHTRVSEIQCRLVVLSYDVYANWIILKYLKYENTIKVYLKSWHKYLPSMPSITPTQMKNITIFPSPDVFRPYLPSLSFYRSTIPFLPVFIPDNEIT